MNKVILVGIGIALFILADVFLTGALVTWLWNWVIVALFHAEPISYWLGVGVGLVLAVLGAIFSRKGGKNSD